MSKEFFEKNRLILDKITASPLIWNKIITDVNINSVLYKVTGIATLSLGSIAVSCPSIATNDIIELHYQTASGIPGAIFVSSVTPGTGFTVQSTSLLDTGVFQWNILNQQNNNEIAIFV